jgi:2-polyprenyl-3-methyl-5-hydroxy-6-metoxy-1,4-benzoquinol methylase
LHAEGRSEADRIAAYSKLLEADNGFEAVLVRARQTCVSRFLDHFADPHVIEVGCGPDLLFPRYLSGHSCQSWMIVEPSEQFCEMARERAVSFAQVEVVQGFLEDVADRLAGRPAEAVIASSLLHEVPDVDVFLARAALLLQPEGMVHVNVPNGLSLHRRLARAMGLIEHEETLSERNVLLEQRRVLDKDTLRQAVERSGLDVVEAGGYFLKPFTHEQMANLPFLNDQMLLGLDVLGQELPDMASEIFVNCRLRQRTRSTS